MSTSLLIAVAILSAPAEWNVGVAKVVITPAEPTWLSGYGARTEPAQGKVHDLYAKAVIIEDSAKAHLVLVTCDLGSVSPYITAAVAKASGEKYGIDPQTVVINISHTHCAPEVAAERSVFHDLRPAEESKLARYIDKELIPKLIDLIGTARKAMQPATLSVSQSAAGFAKNRRLPTPNGFVNQPNEEGVVDHDVPVLKVHGTDGSLHAIVFGYACHNTTLAFQLYCGDYAGFAQEYVEQKHPGATALFVMGCGGDQNPYPRHGEKGLEYARQHGRSLADAVERALEAKPTIVHGPLRVAQETVTLELEPLPPIAELENQSLGPPGLAKRKADYLLAQLEQHGKVELTQTCPLLAARFGNELLFLAISGETVVDYSRISKREFAGPTVWVAGYCNDVFAYLPSRRVLQEGGYEGRTGIIHQLVPTPFTASVEDRVMGGLRRLVRDISKPGD